MTSRQTGFALLQLGEALLVIGLLFFQAVTTAWAADLTWMAEEQNCKQFIRKFQAELRGESGIRSMPEGEQREARDALRKACAGPIGRCEFSFCSVEGDEPVVINRPIAKVDIGALIGTGEGEAPEANARPAPTLPAERRAPVGDAKNANAKKASAPRERHPLYDPRQRRLLDELDAEDEAEKQRSAAARAAEDQLKEQLLRELGTQDPSPGLNLSVDQVVLERARKPEPQPTPTAAVEDVVEVTPSPREQPEALATLTQPEVEAAPTATPDSREEMEAVATPSIALANVTPTPSELTSLPPIDEVRKPTSPWSRAGTFPRTPISTSTTVAPALQESPEALARAADLARQQRLQWLKNEMGCKELASFREPG